MRKDSYRRPPEDPSWQEGADDDPDQAVQEMKRSLARAKALVSRARRSLAPGEDDGADAGTGREPRR